MRLAAAIATIIFLSACGHLTDNSEITTAKEIDISFTPAKIKIPKQYKQHSPGELKKIIENSGGPADLIAMRTSKIDGLANSNIGFDIYVDTTNTENTILFMQGTGVRLTPSLIQEYLTLIDQQLTKSWTPYGFQFKIVDSKIFTNNGIDFLKVKYEVTYQDSKTHLTQYLVTQNKKGIGVLVDNEGSADY